ncbi:hypothetical protein F0562_031383 [Nyssa sinensis]|uniref:Uncharacterized protein n=1 Tax=Nyssa sinensis TaxID=561372 RepID=A0A5J5AVD6_9ASTE|nr:hypothetical protein F0562_031383 [Nyssa sinensis]
MEAGTDTVIGAGHIPLLGMVIRGRPDVQFAHSSGFINRYLNFEIRRALLRLYSLPIINIIRGERVEVDITSLQQKDFRHSENLLQWTEMQICTS